MNKRRISALVRKAYVKMGVKPVCHYYYVKHEGRRHACAMGAAALALGINLDGETERYLTIYRALKLSRPEIDGIVSGFDNTYGASKPDVSSAGYLEGYAYGQLLRKRYHPKELLI